MSAETFGVQSPLLLLAMLGIVVPIAIHLFSKSKGIRVSFGSLKFIHQRKPVKMTQIRLVEPVLLMLRVLLVILTVLFLAQIYFSSTKSTQEKILVVSEDWLSSASVEDKKQLMANQANTLYLLNVAASQLLSDGSELYALTDDDVLNWNTDKRNSTHSSNTINLVNSEKSLNTWALLDNVIHSHPNVKEFIVYTTDRLNQFSGEKILLTANVKWNILAVNNKENFSKKASKVKPFKLTVMTEADTKHEKLQKALSLITQKFPQIAVNFINTEQATTKGDLAEDDLQKKNELAPHWIVYLSEENIPKTIINSVALGGVLFAPYSHWQTLSESFSALTTPSKDHGISVLSQLAVHQFGLGYVYSFTKTEKQQGDDYKKVESNQDMWRALLAKNYFPQVLLNLLTDQQQTAYVLKNTSLTREQITSTEVIKKSGSNDIGSSTISEQDNVIAQQNMILAAGKKPDVETHLKLFMLLLLIWALERLVSEFSKHKSQLILKGHNDD